MEKNNTNIRKYLKTKPIYEITRYTSQTNYAKNNVAFTGAPKKHPYDKDKIILISDPFSANTIFYEFNLNDIIHVDELPSLVAESGESLQIVRIWVKKGSFGLRYEPFIVEDTLKQMKDVEGSLFNKSKKSNK